MTTTTAQVVIVHASDTSLWPAIISAVGVLVGGFITYLGTAKMASARLNSEAAAHEARLKAEAAVNKARIDAEREARSHEAAERRAENRRQFQRETLIELQDALASLVRVVGRGQHHDEMHHRANPEEDFGSSRWPEGLAEEFTRWTVEVLKLTSRVEDDDLRDMLVNLRSLIAQTSAERTREGSNQKMLEAMTLYETAQNKLSDLFRHT